MVAGLVDVLKNPATLQRMWQNAMAMIKKANPAHAVFFFNTRPVLDEAHGVLIIEVDASNAFAANALQKPDVQEELQKCLDAAAGAPVIYQIQTKEGAAAPVAAPVTVSAPAPVAAPVATAVPAAPVAAPAPVAAAAPVAAPAPTPAPAPEPAPAPVAPAPAPAEAPVPAAAPVPSASDTPPWDEPPVPPTAPTASVPMPPIAPEPAGDEASAEDLNAILSGAFGEGIVFTEQ